MIARVLLVIFGAASWQDKPEDRGAILSHIMQDSATEEHKEQSARTQRISHPPNDRIVGELDGHLQAGTRKRMGMSHDGMVGQNSHQVCTQVGRPEEVGVEIESAKEFTEIART